MVRFPAIWTAELRARPAQRQPIAPVPILERKPATRLPPKWAASFRATPPLSRTKAVNKSASRLPAQWAAELRTKKISVPAKSVRKSSARLPSQWAATLRAGAGKAIVLERPLQLPEQPIEYDVNIKRIVEAILFAANKPMTVKQIQEAFPELEQPDTLEIQMALEAIARDYMTRPIGLKQLASGYRFQIREGMAPWVTRLFEEKPARYSRALLETLSIIAYRQPVTRGEIEDIRGVSVSSGIIHTLLEREWIRVIAHKEVPGRPALYGTTKQFLDYFNLTSLSELPTLQEISDLDFSNEQLPQEHRERPQTEPSETEVVSTSAAEQETASDTEAKADNGCETRTLH